MFPIPKSVFVSFNYKANTDVVLHVTWWANLQSQNTSLYFTDSNMSRCCVGLWLPGARSLGWPWPGRDHSNTPPGAGHGGHQGSPKPFPADGDRHRSAGRSGHPQAGHNMVASVTPARPCIRAWAGSGPQGQRMGLAVASPQHGWGFCLRSLGQYWPEPSN